MSKQSMSQGSVEGERIREKEEIAGSDAEVEVSSDLVEAVTRVQAVIRSKQARAQYLRLKHAAATVQKQVRQTQKRSEHAEAGERLTCVSSAPPRRRGGERRHGGGVKDAVVPLAQARWSR